MFFQTAAVALLAGAAAAVPTFPAHRRGVLSDLHVRTSPSSNSSNSTTTPAGGFKQVVYWGQYYEAPLKDVCAKEQGIDTVVLSFINDYGNSTNGQANANVNYTCLTSKTDDKWTMDQCHSIGDDVKACQGMGKKVLISIGGYGEYSKVDDAQKFADSLWNAYGEGKGDKAFGDGVIVDGFDFDIEHGDAESNKPLSDAIGILRKNFESSSKKFMITSAPQCPKSEHYMSQMIKDAKFDEVYMQFYNNPGCSTDTPKGVSDAWDYWIDLINSGASKGAKMYLGMPAGQKAAGDGLTGGADPYYIKPKEVAPLVTDMMKKKQFGGAMLWDASNAMNNTDAGNSKNYNQNIRCLLDNGKLC